MKCDELKDYDYDPDFPFQSRGRFYVADEVDAAIAELKQKLQDQCISCPVKMQEDDVIADLEERHKKEVEQLLIEIVKLKTDYKEACDRLQTANLIKDEQKVKANKLLSSLKYLVMRDLIKDCPPKNVAAEIVKEYDNGLR